MKQLVNLSLATAAFLIGTTCAHAQLEYTAQRLATYSNLNPGSDFPAKAHDVNANNVVVGEADADDGHTRCFVWDQSGALGSPARSFRLGGLFSGGNTQFQCVSGNLAAGYYRISSSQIAPLVCTNVMVTGFESNYQSLDPGDSGGSGRIYDSNRGEGGSYHVGYATVGGVLLPAFWYWNSGSTAPKTVGTGTGAFRGVSASNRAVGYRTVSGVVRAFWADLNTSGAAVSGNNLSLSRATGGSAFSEARAFGVSPDGQIIVGEANNGSYWEMVFWLRTGASTYSATYPTGVGGQLNGISNPVSPLGGLYYAVGSGNWNGSNRAVGIVLNGSTAAGSVVDLTQVNLNGYSLGGRYFYDAQGVQNQSAANKLPSIVGYSTGAAQTDAIVCRSALAFGPSGGIAIGSVQRIDSTDLITSGGTWYGFHAALQYEGSSNPLHENRDQGISNSYGLPMSGGTVRFQGQSDVGNGSCGGTRYSNDFSIYIPAYYYGNDITVYCDTNSIGFSQIPYTISIPKETTSLQLLSPVNQTVPLGSNVTFQARLTSTDSHRYGAGLGGIPVHFQLKSGTTVVWDSGAINTDGNGYVTTTWNDIFPGAPGTYQVVAYSDDNGHQWGTTSGPSALTLTKFPAYFANLSAVSGWVDNVVILQAKLVRQNNNSIAGRPVGFYQGSTYLGTTSTDSSGVATAYFRVPNLPVGNQSYVAKFAGDTYFEAAQDGVYTLSINNTPPTAGLLPAAVSLHDEDQAIQLPGDQYFPAGGFTIEGWVKPYTALNWSRLMDFGNRPGNVPTDCVYLAVFEAVSGLQRCHFGTQSGTNTQFFAGSQSVTLGQWNHLSVAVDPTGYSVLYLNGQPVGSGTLPYPAAVYRSSCYLGMSNWSADPELQGQLSDFRLYQGARSQSQIQADMVTLANNASPNLLVGIPLDEGAGQTTLFLDGVRAGTVTKPAIWVGASPGVNTVKVHSGSNPLPKLGFDPNGGALTFELLEPPTQGSLTGTFPNLSYTPGSNFDGADSFIYQVRDAQGAASNTFQLNLKSDVAVITFTCNFQDYFGDGSEEFAYEVVNSQGTVVDSGTGVTNQNSASIQTAATGVVRLRVKPAHWLSKLSNPVTLSGSTNVGLLSFLNGDIDGDNSISIFDYVVLSDFFDESSADPDWNTVHGNGYKPSDADLDDDGAVTIFDYLILTNNFDLTGE
ncbi:MAG: Ig-like domain repeat protein [Armatimonadetes bacterium]|nr:Ig-like domain repeat protein [Armatimonadota bacterium]